MVMKKLRVLIADDSSLMRDIIRESLGEEFEFIEPVMATNGEEARQKLLAGSHFDLILCDWEMPGLNGDELLRWLREESHIKNVPFIMITAKDDGESIMEVIKLGVTDYIVKPFSPETLCEKVTRVFKKLGSSPQ
jgi:DNA-binding response OmpR family regulator